MCRLEDHYPIGCPMDEPEWSRADDAITDAYWSGDLAELRRAACAGMNASRCAASKVPHQP